MSLFFFRLPGCDQKKGFTDELVTERLCGYPGLCSALPAPEGTCVRGRWAANLAAAAAVCGSESTCGTFSVAVSVVGT